MAKSVKVMSFSARNTKSMEESLNQLMPEYEIEEVTSVTYQSGKGNVAVMKTRIVVVLVKTYTSA